MRTNINKIGINDFITRDRHKHWYTKKYNDDFLKICIELDQVKISMIRIWNYNCDRISSNIGVKSIAIVNKPNMDVIFVGQIKKASGNLIKLQKNYDSILFTSDVKVLKAISQNDFIFQKSRKTPKSNNKIQAEYNKRLIMRPLTIDKNIKENVIQIPTNMNFSFENSQNSENNFIETQRIFIHVM